MIDKSVRRRHRACWCAATSRSSSKVRRDRSGRHGGVQDAAGRRKASRRQPRRDDAAASEPGSARSRARPQSTPNAPAARLRPLLRRARSPRTGVSDAQWVDAVRQACAHDASSNCRAARTRCMPAMARPSKGGLAATSSLACGRASAVAAPICRPVAPALPPAATVARRACRSRSPIIRCRRPRSPIRADVAMPDRARPIRASAGGSRKSR